MSTASTEHKPDTAPRFLKSSEVAPLFRVSRTTIHRWCVAGLLPGARRIGRAWLIPAATVEELTEVAS